MSRAPAPLRLARLVRVQAVEAARLALAEALATAAAAEAAERAAAEAIGREAALATDLASGDGAVEAFAAWLPQGQLALATCRQARAAAECRVTVARAALAAAHQAEEAVRRLLDGDRARREEREAAAAQVARDDRAGRRLVRPHATPDQEC